MRILLIDDDKDDQNLFSEAISNISNDIIITACDNGLHGLKYLNSTTQLPDVVFLDINMPLMDGRETLEIIRATESLRRLRVVIYSTSCSETDIRWFEGMGAEYLTKPNNFEILVDVLKDKLTKQTNRVNKPHANTNVHTHLA